MTYPESRGSSTQGHFTRALDLPAGPERERFLADLPAEDSEREEIRQLLDAYEAAGAADFLESPSGMIAERAEVSLGEKIGPYELVREIGEGGFGVVFEALQTDPLKRRVALKIVKPGMDTRALIARFEAERQALARLEHPNIAQIFDAGASDSGRPFFAMELVSGVPITDFCDAKNLPIPDRLRLLAKVCVAVQYAHQKGLIHRDLKPSNVLVTTELGKPEPKIIDFGIAKIIDPTDEPANFTLQGQFMGTPQHTSPEQARSGGSGADTRSDVFALGVLLHELLTGETPLDPEDLRSVTQGKLETRIAEFEAQPPSTRLASLPRELDWITLRALENDPDRRYQTPLDLARDLERFLANQPVEASPPSQIYRARKFARRHRTAIGMISAVTVLLIIATVVSSWQAVLAKRRQLEAEQARNEANRIAGYLASVIYDAAPQGRKVDPEEMLDRATARLGGSFPNQPAIRARLLNELGVSYLRAGFRAKAIQRHEEALAICRENLGSTHLQTFESLLHLSGRLNDARRSKEALPLAVEAFQFAQNRNNQPEMLRAIRRLVQIHEQMPGFERGNEWHSKLIRQTEALFGPDSARSLSAHLDYADFLVTKDRADEALMIYRRCSEQDEAASRQNQIQRSIAQVHLRQNQPDLAISVLQDLLQRQNPTSQDGRENRYRLVQARFKAGQLAEALEEMEILYQDVQIICGPNHPATQNCRTLLARILVKSGKPESAIELLNQVYAVRQRVVGSQDSLLASTLNDLADAQKAAGNLKAAANSLKERLQILKSVYGPENPLSVNASKQLTALEARLESGN